MKRSHFALSLLTLCGCASGTEGRIVRVELAVQAEPEPERELGAFETATGWEVTLDRAELALSAIYAFAPEQEPSVMARLSRLIVPVAHAHGGHDPLSGKRVRAELIEPLAADLLSEGRLELGEIEAEAGAVAALAVDIASPSSPATAELDGHQAWVSGEARRGDARIRFAGGLQIPDDGLMRRVETMVADLELEDGEKLVIGIRPSVWLRQAEFDRLAPGADGEPAAITAESQVGRALFIGARSPAAFSMNAIPEETSHD
jgi:hypothetical protein